MRRLLLGALVILAACAKSTPAGPLGEVDLTKQLPAGVTAPAQLEARDSAHAMCPGGKGDQPASIHVSWKTFAANGSRYVASYKVELVKAVSGLQLKLDAAPTPTMTNAAGSPMQVVPIAVSCVRGQGDKVEMDEPDVFYIRGDGYAETRSHAD